MIEAREPRYSHPVWLLKLRLQRVVMFVGLFSFTTAIFLQVVTRYVFNYSLFGIEEFVSYVGVVTYFVGTAYATNERSHISASLVETLFGDGKVTALSHAITRLLAVLLTLYILVPLWELLVFTTKMNARSVELRLPMVWVYGPMFASLSLTAFYFALEFLDALRTLRHRFAAGSPRP